MKLKISFSIVIYAIAVLVIIFPNVCGKDRKSVDINKGLRIQVSCSKRLCTEPIDGRILLILSTSDKIDTRLGFGYILQGPNQLFGIDVDGFNESQKVTFNSSVTGYPAENLSAIPSGDYYVQSLLNVYETFHRADGHTIKLPMDHGEGQRWYFKPGNLFSKPFKIHIDSAENRVINVELIEKIPPMETPKDTRYIKHLNIHSELLSKFWGRNMEIGAVVLLPDGWDEHPEARYPLFIHHDHFFWQFLPAFQTEAPKQSSKGFERLYGSYGYKFYQEWISGRLPRVLILMLQTPNPYYDDAYAVNSANVGPYGDAIMKEVIPEVEKRFRGIGQGWARAAYGGSTGGWAALAQQIFYPDELNGAWGFCPDPIDFRSTGIVNLYEDKNALWLEGPFSRTPRPFSREVDGTISITMDQQNRREMVLGTHGRSAGQLGIWQALYSPVGEDGYPKPIWDPMTGVIDHKVAKFWRDNYDLRYILERDWKTLGPKLEGKVHITVGTLDTFYLNNAVRWMEDFLKNTTTPHYAGEIVYGQNKSHCYCGGEEKQDVNDDMFTITQRFLPKAVSWMEKTAPSGADLKSWKY